jgi:hypothetical protein
MIDQAHRIDWEFFDRATADAIAVGELVSAAAGGLPIYRVMSISGGRAWLKDIDGGPDRVTPLTDFHWKASEPAF